MKSFHEKYENLLKSEGFTIQNQTENKIDYIRTDGISIHVKKKDDQYVNVVSILPKDKIEYTTTISHADPSGIFERLIRRFHNQNMYQNT